MIQDLIDSEQSNVESRLTRDEHKQTYNSIMLPSIEALVQKMESINISTLPTKLTISKPVDVYAEALTVFAIRNPNAVLPIRLIAYIIVAHPFMLTVFQLRHNHKSYQTFQTQLLETMENDFDALPQAKPLIRILKQPMLEQSACSAFHQFHYLMGFYFKPNSIAQTPSNLTAQIDELVKDNHINKQQLIFIAINAAFNVKNTNSIIMYSNVPKSKARIINESTIESFNSIHQSNQTQQPKSPFTILNHQFSPLNISTNETDKLNYTHSLVLINYNDGTDYSTNHYTIAYFGKFGVLDKRLTLEFISFKLLRAIDNRLLTFYLQESFYEHIYDNQLTIDQLKRSYTQLMNATSSAFNRSNSSSECINNIIANVSAQQLIDEHEMPYFKVYLSKLNKLQPYDTQNVINYVLAYIYPDLLTSSSEL